MKNEQQSPKQSPFSMPRTLTLVVRICGAIETPPEGNREKFRQGIMQTVLELVRRGAFEVEYIGYVPDRDGTQYLNKAVAEYDDCVLASFSITDSAFHGLNVDARADEVLEAFTQLFEDKTHRHLAIDSVAIRKGNQQRLIQMSSDWRFLREQG